jgi:type I restriction enzyme, S subunit
VSFAIHQHWEAAFGKFGDWYRVRDHFQLINGYPFKSENFNADGIGRPLVRIRDLLSDSLPTFFDGNEGQDVVVTDGDIVIGMDGDFNSVTWTKGEALLNQRVCALRATDHSGVDPRFLGYQIPISLKVVNDLTPWSTVKHLSSLDVLSLRFPRYDLATQRQIADFLDRETARIDLLIEKKQKLVALLGEKRKSYISQKINRNKDAQKLKNVVQVLNGYAFKSDLFQDDGIPVVRQSNLKNGKIVHDGRCYPTALTPRNFLLKKDDLCIGLSGSIENFGLITTEELPAALNQRVGVLRSKQNRCHADYLIFYVQSEMFKDHIQKNLPSTTIVNIDAQLIRNAPFPTIKYEEQVLESRKMLEVTSAIEKVCDGTITSIDRLKEYRSALITAAVTGQIDVTIYAKSGAAERRLDAVEEVCE